MDGELGRDACEVPDTRVDTSGSVKVTRGTRSFTPLSADGKMKLRTYGNGYLSVNARKSHRHEGLPACIVRELLRSNTVA